MLTAVSALIVYLAAAFPGGETRYAVFADLESCQAAVAQVRAQGVFATDCVPVELPKPSNGQSS